MQSVKKAVVFSGGAYEDLSVLRGYIPDDSYVICADSGVKLCEMLGMCADLIVGDFDSFDYSCLRNLSCAQNSDFIPLNPQKDDTDTEFAIAKALEKGCKDIYLIGGIGSRIDHTLANIFMMEKCHKSGASLTLFNEKNILHYVCGNSIALKKSRMRYVSLIPLEKIRVSATGFLYPLDNEILCRDSSRGISNELVSDLGIITIHEGAALVTETVD